MIIAKNAMTYVIECEREEARKQWEAEQERILQQEALEAQWYNTDIELKQEQLRQEKLKTQLLEEQLKSLKSN